MNQPNTEHTLVVPRIAASNNSLPSLADDPKLHGIWLLLGRLSWGVVGIATLLLTLVSLPAYLTVLRTSCSVSAPSCNQLQLTPEQVRQLATIGLSLSSYAIYGVAATLLVLLVNGVVSALIMWQRSRLRIGLVVALGLLVFNTFDPTNLLQGSTSVWLILAGVLKFLQSALILLLGFTFPSGRFVPRWTIWVCFALVIALLFANFLPELVGFALIIGLQIYRYRRVSTPRQRQQTKWVVYAVILALGITAILEGIAVITAIQQGLAVPLIVQGQGYSSPIAQLVQLAASLLAPWLALCFPLAFAAALLRSHLWDIDVLINRTLVYGGLSAILGALYAGLIIGLESLTGRIGGTVATNPLVLVVSTLAIAALVQPLRRRLQTTVDRRFYRQKYDAEQTLANFSDSLRHQIDLEQLRAQLLSVVQETMQPVQVSLWLRAPQWHFTTAAIPPDEPPANAFLP